MLRPLFAMHLVPTASFDTTGTCCKTLGVHFAAGLLRDAVSQHRDRPRVACAAVCFVPDPAVVPPPPPPERWREVSASLLLTPSTVPSLTPCSPPFSITRL